MKRSRFSEEQIIGILREHQAGARTADLCRKHGISDATFYKWRSRFGGMEVSDAKKLRALEAENAKLKKLLAESMIDVSTLREMLGKNSEAQFEEVCRELGYERKTIQPEEGLPPGWNRSARVPLSIDATGRRWRAGQAARVGRRTPPVRLSAFAHPVGP